MSEIEDRIATVWPGRPTAADVEATRLADLRAVLEVTNALAARVTAVEGMWVNIQDAEASANDLADRIEVQADITGQLGASFHALAARVAALEGQGNRVGGTVPESSAVTSASPAPPAPLVERMWRAYSSCESTSCLESMAAALLVAAEDLLGPVTEAEAKLAMWTDGEVRAINLTIKARLARAKEAARG